MESNRMTNHHRRSGLILGLALAAGVAAAAAVGCGEATIKTFVPCATPTAVDPTFTGVLAVFQSKDCFNGAGCHNAQNPGGPASQLALGGEDSHLVYLNIMSGGAQAHGGDKDVVVGSNAAASLLLKKPLA
ncbi:MAG TPA: hypothetical protein VMV18_07455, partial [bacterium]|nr:hypothetical protein [bacterium]